MRKQIGIEEASYGGNSAFGLVRLLVVPAIALAMLLGLSVESAARETAPAPKADAAVKRVADERYSLYLYADENALPARHQAELVRVQTGAPAADWYARVTTPAEEAEVMKLWEHANWIRHDVGLTAIGLVDLRMQ